MSERQDLSRKLCSEEEMRALNSKEALILISNLSSESIIPQQEIITDVTQMRTIANGRESLEGMGSSCLTRVYQYENYTPPPSKRGHALFVRNK